MRSEGVGGGGGVELVSKLSIGGKCDTSSNINWCAKILKNVNPKHLFFSHFNF